MRLALLAARNSIHTVRWANSLAERGHEVHLISIHRGGEKLDERIRVTYMLVPPPSGYFLNVLQLHRLLRDLRPEIVHAHYASGYGTLARLSGYHPYVLSVWGSDIYEFPQRSSRHRNTIVQNLRAADQVCSTSQAMKAQALLLAPGLSIEVVPFGVDTDQFTPRDLSRVSEVLTVGTVKALAPQYGIDILLRAFAAACQDVAEKSSPDKASMRLLIVGGGSHESRLKALAHEIGLDSVATFTGQIPHKDVPTYLRKLDVFVAPSRSESFGVAVVEASACGLPVIVSDVGGLPEVVVSGVTGLVVPRESVTATADAIRRLAQDRSLRMKMGVSARKHVIENYQWNKNVTQMERVYERVAYGR